MISSISDVGSESLFLQIRHRLSSATCTISLLLTRYSLSFQLETKPFRPKDFPHSSSRVDIEVTFPKMPVQ